MSIYLWPVAMQGEDASSMHCSTSRAKEQVLCNAANPRMPLLLHNISFVPRKISFVRHNAACSLVCFLRHGY